MSGWARRYLERAERAVESAKSLLELDDRDGACNRAFYAVFDASCAALCGAGATPAKTHRGLIAQFGAKLVQTGSLDRKLGRDLNWAEQTRLYADYTLAVVDRQTAEEMTALAENFISEIRRHLLDKRLI
jgi:uncharacterized protein (UPF0332 family)